MYMSEAAGRPYSGWWRGLLNASLLGSLLLVVAFLAVLIRPRYGYVAALLGASLSWPYFALLSWASTLARLHLARDNSLDGESFSKSTITG